MSEFYRGLNDKALEETHSFLNSGVGQEILRNEHYLICIRDNYINVYYNGCSILKYKPLATKNEFLIHHEYYPQSEKKGNDPYVRLDFKKEEMEKSFISLIKEPSNYLKKHISREKECIADYLDSTKPYLLDLEVAFERERDEEEMKGKKRDKIANRLDMAVLKEVDGKIKLQLIEVKIDTDPRLKSEEDGKQEILKQMRHYKNFLDSKTDKIMTSYKIVAENYIKLGAKFPTINRFIPTEVLEEFVNGGTLDLNPSLLVIRTGESMMGRKNCNHWSRLILQFRGENYPEPLSWHYPST